MHRKKEETTAVVRVPRSLDCSSATSTRQTQTRRGQAVTGTHTRTQQQQISSSSSTQRHSSNTRFEQHSCAWCCCCFNAAYCSSISSSMSCRVGFQAPGRLFGSWDPSPELLAGSRDFDHVEHWPRSPAGANACTVLSTAPPCGRRRRKHEKRPAAKRQKVNYSGKNGHLVQSKYIYKVPLQEAPRGVAQDRTGMVVV